MKFLEKIRSYLPWSREDGGPSEAEHAVARREAHTAVDTLFDRLWHGRFDPWSDSIRDLPSILGPGWTPAGLTETEDAYHVELEVPGYEPHEISVEATAHELRVRATQVNESRSGGRWERSSGSRFLTVPLRGEADSSRAEASLRNGVLQVQLPKSERARSRVRRIPVAA